MFGGYTALGEYGPLVGERLARAQADQDGPAGPDSLLDRRIDIMAELRASGTALTADEAGRRARQSAPSRARLNAAVRAAQAGAREARVALLPRIQFLAQYTRLNPVDRPDAFPYFVNQSRFGASASFPLRDAIASGVPSLRAASRSIDEQKQLERAEEAAIELRAKQAFFEYFRARGLAIIARAGVDQAKLHARHTRLLHRAGRIAAPDVLRAEAQLASAQIAVASANAGVHRAQHALCTLLHEEQCGTFALQDQLQTPPLSPRETNEAELIDIALRNRPEMRALRYRTKALAHSLRAAYGEMFPEVEFLAGIDGVNPNLLVIPQRQEYTLAWSVGGALTWSPNGTAIGSAKAARVRALIDQARAESRELADGIKNEVHTAHGNYTAAVTSLLSASTGIKAAEANYRSRVLRYQRGSSRLDEVIDADAEVTMARTEFLEAGIEVHLAYAELIRASANHQAEPTRTAKPAAPPNTESASPPRETPPLTDDPSREDPPIERKKEDTSPEQPWYLRQQSFLDSCSALDRARCTPRRPTQGVGTQGGVAQRETTQGETAWL